MSFVVELISNVAGSVVVLFAGCSPSTVGRRIITIVINPIEWLVFFAERRIITGFISPCPECSIVVPPFIAYFDSTSAVAMIPFAIRILATIDHSVVYAIEPLWFSTVLIHGSFFAALWFFHTAAAFACPISQRSAVHYSFGAAIALAKPHRSAICIASGTFDCCPASKPLIG